MLPWNGHPNFLSHRPSHLARTRISLLAPLSPFCAMGIKERKEGKVGATRLSDRVIKQQRGYGKNLHIFSWILQALIHVDLKIAPFGATVSTRLRAAHFVCLTRLPNMGDFVFTYSNAVASAEAPLTTASGLSLVRR